MIRVAEKRTGMSTVAYPKLMKADNGDVVLFNRESVGTVVKSKYYPIGFCCVLWNMGLFKDYNGTIELSNE